MRRLALFLVSLSATSLALALSPTSAVAAQPGDQPVLIHMQVPANAEVWFDGAPTSKTVPVRDFFSAPIAAGKNYSYQVRVRWMADGQPVDLERKVQVRAGQQVNLDVSGQNVRVSRTAFYPAVATRTPTPSYYYSPSVWSTSYGPTYSVGSSGGLPLLSYEPVDPHDYFLWNAVGNE